MGIGLNTTHLLLGAFRNLDDLSTKRLLTIGVQDCHFTYPKLVNFLDRHGVQFRPLPEDEIEYTTGFKWIPTSERSTFENYVHQRTLFRLLGFSPNNIHSLDASDYEHPTIVHDLNVTLGDEDISGYDAIFDGGTLEHVFSIRDAFFNLIRLCNEGGLIIHASPVDLLNHGYFNFTAELFEDVYTANGFEKIFMKYVAIPLKDARSVDRYYLMFEPHDLMMTLQPYYNILIFTVFKRVEMKEFVVPQQGQYRSSIWLQDDQKKGSGSVEARASKLRRAVVSAIDRHFLLSFLVRSSHCMRKAEKIRM